jgi:outer membrane protein assembly factor BamB
VRKILVVAIIAGCIALPSRIQAQDSFAIPPFKLSAKWSVGGSYGSVYAPVAYGNSFALGNLSGKFVLTENEKRKMELDIDNADISTSPCIDGNYAFIGTKVGTMAKINLVNGSFEWVFKTRNAIFGKPVVANEKLYFGSADESFYCLSALTGEKQFEVKINSPIWSTPVVVGEKVIFGADDNKTHCINAKTGSILWSFIGNGWFEATPVVYGGYVIIGSLDHKVYCLSIGDGSLSWSFQAKGAVKGNGVLLGNSYVFADDAGSVYAIDADTGRELWKKEGYGAVSWPLAGDSERAYFVDSNKFFVGLSKEGNQIWKRKLLHAVRSELAVSHGQIAFVTSDGTMEIWEESAYCEVSPSSFDLGEISFKRVQVFGIKLALGREDNRISSPMMGESPWEAGRHCHSVKVAHQGSKKSGNRTTYNYDMVVNFSDPSYKDGDDYISLVIEPNCPVKMGNGEYQEPSMDGQIMISFKFNLEGKGTNNATTCEPCYKIKVTPEGTPYFPRNSKGKFVIDIDVTDKYDHWFTFETENLPWIAIGSKKILSSDGKVQFEVSFDCFDLPGGSDFSFEYKIQTTTCVEKGGNVSWTTIRSMDFTTDPRFRIEMMPGNNATLVNDKTTVLDVPAEVYKGRTLVPIRFVAETFGCMVDWEPNEKLVTIKFKNKILKYWAYKDYAEFNGEKVTIDVGPIIRSGRTLVPLRSVAESLGATVRWIQSQKLIIIDWEF